MDKEIQQERKEVKDLNLHGESDLAMLFFFLSNIAIILNLVLVAGYFVMSFFVHVAIPFLISSPDEFWEHDGD